MLLWACCAQSRLFGIYWFWKLSRGWSLCCPSPPLGPKVKRFFFHVLKISDCKTTGLLKIHYFLTFSKFYKSWNHGFWILFYFFIILESETTNIQSYINYLEYIGWRVLFFFLANRLLDYLQTFLWFETVSTTLLKTIKILRYSDFVQTGNSRFLGFL